MVPWMIDEPDERGAARRRVLLRHGSAAISIDASCHPWLRTLVHQPCGTSSCGMQWRQLGVSVLPKMGLRGRGGVPKTVRVTVPLARMIHQPLSIDGELPALCRHEQDHRGLD